VPTGPVRPLTLPAGRYSPKGLKVKWSDVGTPTLVTIPMVAPTPERSPISWERAKEPPLI
jgi:hypothetical protein